MKLLPLSICTSSLLTALAWGCGDSADRGPQGTGNEAGAAADPGETGGAGGSGNDDRESDDPECVPTTCAAEQIECGIIFDGCEGEIDCGSCPEDNCETSGVGCECEDGQSARTRTRAARRARSAGFSGTDAQYAELYSALCQEESDCVDPCVARGGEPEMCAASECLPNPDMTMDCLPAPVWSHLSGIRFSSDVPAEAVQLVVVATSYSDPLIADEFKLEVPEEATINGITVEVRRASGGHVTDDSVRIVKGGVVRNAERAEPVEWEQEFTWVTYGGPDDLWGQPWTAEDVNADDFGVALSTFYTRSVGNTRAYIDQVRITVHYEVGCGD